MTKLIRLTDIQLVLLASAAARDNGSLLPPPETVGEGPARIRKVVEQLIRRGLAAEVELPDGADAWRSEGKRQIGVVITDEGRAALAGEDEDGGGTAEAHSAGEAAADVMPASAPAPAPAPASAPAPAPASIIPTALVPAAPTVPTSSKIAEVLALMARKEGATLDELVAATGWLPHSTRAALTGLRKKGHAIARGKRGDVSCYMLAAAATA